MNPKKKSNLELLKKDVDTEIKYDPTELEDRLNEETQPPLKEKEEDTIPPIVWVKTEYVHVYEQVTNGGKRIGVLRQGAKVNELSRTHNWVEIQSVDKPEIKGFVRPGSLDQG